MQLLLLLSSLFFVSSSSCIQYSGLKDCTELVCSSGKSCTTINGCSTYICDGCKGSFGCLVNIDPTPLPACTNVTSCASVPSCTCSARSNCGTYTCPTLCSGTGNVDGGQCSSIGQNIPVDCNSGIWTQLRTCPEVQQKCASASCRSGEFNYGKYQCYGNNGCSGWFCSNPPCIQDLQCPQLELDLNDLNFCTTLNKKCNENSLGDLIYSSVTEKEGLYQCFRCSENKMGNVIVKDQSFREDSDINSGMAVLYFIIGFIGGSGLIYLAAFSMNRHYNPSKKGPKKSSKEWIQAQLRWSRQKIIDSIKNIFFGDIKSENFKYHFINNHELFAMTCLSDPLEHNRILNIRCNIAKLMITVALSFVFCGIDVSNSVKRNTCSFDGRNGSTTSQNILEKSSTSTIELPTLSYSIALLVFFLKSILILPSISYLKGIVYLNLKQAEKNKRFLLNSFALIIEISWVIILVSCLEAEKTITSTAKVEDKFSLYFKTIAIIAAMDWIGWNNINIVGSYFLNKKFGKKKYESAAISSPVAAEPTTVV